MLSGHIKEGHVNVKPDFMMFVNVCLVWALRRALCVGYSIMHRPYLNMHLGCRCCAISVSYRQQGASVRCYCR